MPKAIFDEIGVGIEFEFFGEARPVGADGFGVQGEAGGDFFEAFAVRKHEEDLHFTLGKGVVEKFLAVFVGGIGQDKGEAAGDVALAVEKKVDGGEEFLRRGFLGKVGSGTAFYRTATVDLDGVCAEDKRRDGDGEVTRRLDELKSIAVTEVNITYD